MQSPAKTNPQTANKLILFSRLWMWLDRTTFLYAARLARNDYRPKTECAQVGEFLEDTYISENIRLR